METEKLVEDLRRIGLRKGDLVMVHSSYKSLGIDNPEEIILALLGVLGETGTLLFPALSYMQDPPHIHNTLSTPGCVGYLAEYFRLRSGTRRSLHPTHSVCAVGYHTSEMLDDHILDVTPCGEHSPFNKLLHWGGKILMLGCGLEPNTSMHAIEEYARPPYLFGDPLVYTITDASGKTFQKEYIQHNFAGVIQRYDRVEGILEGGQLVAGKVGRADSYLIDCGALFVRALAKIKENPLYFVDPDGKRTALGDES